MAYPSKELIEEARAFIQKRLDAQLSMSKHLDSLMEKAAEEIVNIALRYNVTPATFNFSSNAKMKLEVDNVIENLMDDIYDYTEALITGVAENDSEEALLIGLLNSEKYGETFKERLEKYTGLFRAELETAIAAGLLLGASKSNIISSIRSSMKAPLMNSMVRTSARNGLTPTTLRNGGRGVQTGRGHSNSSRNLIDTLTRTEIAEGWMEILHERSTEAGAKGFYSMRGSSYACDVCDDMVGYHDISEWMGEYHPNCCCIIVFV